MRGDRLADISPRNLLPRHDAVSVILALVAYFKNRNSHHGATICAPDVLLCATQVLMRATEPYQLPDCLSGSALGRASAASI